LIHRMWTVVSVCEANVVTTSPDRSTAVWQVVVRRGQPGCQRVGDPVSDPIT
jgi:hypothetical protein